MATRVTFDTNTWERMFAVDWQADALRPEFDSIRAALRSRTIVGFVCGTTFQLEAIPKLNRAHYIGQSRVDVRLVRMERLQDGSTEVQFSIGPDDNLHPGLHPTQAQKLASAVEHGIRLLDGNAWMWLPSPHRFISRQYFVPLDLNQRARKEERQADVFSFLTDQGVGKSKFDALVADLEREHGLPIGQRGWAALLLASDSQRKMIARAVAEWCDAEIVASHYGYRNDLVCTLDEAGRGGRSVFGSRFRDLLKQRFGIQICSVTELCGAYR